MAPLSSICRHPCVRIDRCLNERAWGTIFPMPSHWQKLGKCVSRRTKPAKPTVCYFSIHHQKGKFWMAYTSAKRRCQYLQRLAVSANARHFALSCRECEREGVDDAAANDGTLATVAKKEDVTGVQRQQNEQRWVAAAGQEEGPHHPQWPLSPHSRRTCSV